MPPPGSFASFPTPPSSDPRPPRSSSPSGATELNIQASSVCSGTADCTNSVSPEVARQRADVRAAATADGAPRKDGPDDLDLAVAGADDFILHVAARDTEDLRSFVVENLNADADVAGTQTSLIFEHLRGASPL